MVRKLYKHEFLAWLRVMSVIWIITLAMAGVHRLLQLFETDTIYYGIVSGSALFVYFVAVMACVASPEIFGIVRFYRNFFTGEGYLTFTLPVTQRAHLWVKLSTAVIFSAASVLVCLLSVMVITAGEVFSEILKAAAFLFQEFSGEELLHVIGWLLELTVLLLVANFSTHLLYGTCICIGQLFRKNRILAAVGVYFGFYLIGQAVNTVLSVAIVILGETGILDSLVIFLENQAEAAIHLFFGVSILLSALLALVYWLISHSILRKRLNLE